MEWDPKRSEEQEAQILAEYEAQQQAGLAQAPEPDGAVPAEDGANPESVPAPESGSPEAALTPRPEEPQTAPETQAPLGREAQLEAELQFEQQRNRSLVGQFRTQKEEIRALQQQLEQLKGDGDEELLKRYNLNDELWDSPETVRGVVNIVKTHLELEREQEREQKGQDFYTELNLLAPNWGQLQQREEFKQFWTPQIQNLLEDALARNNPQQAADVFRRFEMGLFMSPPPPVQPPPAMNPRVLQDIRPQASAAPAPTPAPKPVYNRQEHEYLALEEQHGRISTKEKQQRLEELDRLFAEQLRR